MLKTKLTTGITSIMLLSAVFTTPALADTDIRIAGNGSHSDNDVRVNLDRNITVSQNNDTNISNSVSVNNNTGHNSVNGNTGGDVNVRTGDATANVNISNQAGSNVANISGCCDGGGASIKIEGNGSKSDNSVDFSRSSNLTLIQNNDTDIDNDVNVHNNTGHNSVDGNTWGDVTLETGEAEANVSISNVAGKNVANIDGCCDGGNTHINIVGNGSHSDNSVHVNYDNDKNVHQNNDTDFDNDVNVHNNTGYNDAEGSDKYHKWFKKDHDYDHKKYDHDKDYGKKDHDYDKVKKYYPVVKYFDHDKFKKYDHDKKDYDRKDYDHDKKDYDHSKKEYDRIVKFWPKHDDHKKYEEKKGHDKKVYVHDNKKRDYDHDKISYDWYKKYQPKHDSVSYKKDHHDSDRYDHDKKYYPVFKKVDYNRCDSKHWKGYTTKDWVWYKDNCDHGKKYVHPVVYFDHDKYDHDKKDHKKYDRDDKKHHDSDRYKKVTYKKVDHKKDHDNKYDHGKRHDGNKYVLAKYPKYSYDSNRNDYCDSGKRVHGKDKYSWNKYPHSYGHGNTGGNVSIRTGDARSNVNLHNLGSSNYLNFN
jgi:spore coat protein C